MGGGQLTTAIVWFRRDLRVADNPALWAALSEAERVIPVYLHAPRESGHWRPGAASDWWLHHSLQALNQSLRRLGSRLVLRQGNSQSSLHDLIAETGASQVYWNHLYEPELDTRDRALKSTLDRRSVIVRSFNGSLLHEPSALIRERASPYRVFTPFWKACVAQGLHPPVIPAIDRLPPVPDALVSVELAELRLLPAIPWDDGLREAWHPGELGARRQLQAFLDGALAAYAEDRDHPGSAGTSRLSPHLHFGEISPGRVVAEADLASNRHLGPGAIASSENFRREIGWREFAYHLLYHFPHSTDKPLDQRFQRFAWNPDHGEELQAWCRGVTGFPIVDAGMRELWHTGWMHNRVRMIAASLLTKNLLIPWLAGARWFWDTLVDADLASNTLGWQWTAGCGADAAPYFRIFNPVLQGEKFDPGGDYVRRWVPEIAALPNRFLHQPWRAPETVLADAGIRLGEDYPLPLVDLKTSRQRALARFAEIKRRPS